MGVKVVNIDDVDIEKMQENDGWAISEFRLPITGKMGSKTTVFHSIFRAGSTHAKHLHSNSDEIAIYLSGKGVVGQGESRAEVSKGFCRLMPKGSVHFFYNESLDTDARVVGFYMGAVSVEDTGYSFCGNVEKEDTKLVRDGLNDGILVHLDDLKKLSSGIPKSWIDIGILNPIGGFNGSTHSLYQFSLQAGKKTPESIFPGVEAIYYIDGGKGLISDHISKIPIKRESFAFIPSNTPHSILNTGSDSLIIYMVLTGAKSLDDASSRVIN